MTKKDLCNANLELAKTFSDLIFCEQNAKTIYLNDAALLQFKAYSKRHYKVIDDTGLSLTYIAYMYRYSRSNRHSGTMLRIKTTGSFNLMNATSNLYVDALYERQSYSEVFFNLPNITKHQYLTLMNTILTAYNNALTNCIRINAEDCENELLKEINYI